MIEILDRDEGQNGSALNAVLQRVDITKPNDVGVPAFALPREEYQPDRADSESISDITLELGKDGDLEAYAETRTIDDEREVDDPGDPMDIDDDEERRSPKPSRLGNETQIAIAKKKAHNKTLEDLPAKDDKKGDKENDDDGDEIKMEEQLTYNKIRARWYKTSDEDLKDVLEEILSLGELSVSCHEPVEIEKFRKLIKHAQITRKVLADKYRAVTEKKPSEKFKQRDHPKTAKEVGDMFRGPAELEHPWSVTIQSRGKLPEGGLLMRVTDEASKAKSYPEIGFLSQGSYEDLSTNGKRKASLELHLNWKNRKPTSWISVTGNVRDFIEERVPWMVRRDENKPSRCTVKLSFINGYARVAAGWPILRVKEEIEYYGIGTPKSRDASFFVHEYVLPFRIPVEQIVATYCWNAVEDYIKQNRCNYYAWHAAVILPALREHETARKDGRLVKGKAGCVCCGH